MASVARPASRPVLLLLGLLVGAMTTGCRPQVSTATVQRGPLNYALTAAGLVESESSDMGFQTTGRIVQMYVKEGDRVRRSQLLARVSPLPSIPNTLDASDVITAPYDARVVMVYERVGAVVNPGQAVLRLISDEAPWVTVFVESEDAVHLRRGDHLQCRAGGYLSQAWELVVEQVGSQAVVRPDLPGSSRQVRVKCSVASPGFPLAPGSEVDVDGEFALVADALLVPTAAVVRGPSGDQVWVVTDGRVKARPVQVGPNNFDLIVVTQGLAEGETVVVEGKAGLREGESVKAQPEPGATTANREGE